MVDTWYLNPSYAQADYPDSSIVVLMASVSAWLAPLVELKGLSMIIIVNILDVEFPSIPDEDADDANATAYLMNSDMTSTMIENTSTEQKVYIEVACVIQVAFILDLNIAASIQNDPLGTVSTLVMYVSYTSAQQVSLNIHQTSNFAQAVSLIFIFMYSLFIENGV